MTDQALEGEILPATREPMPKPRKRRGQARRFTPERTEVFFEYLRKLGGNVRYCCRQVDVSTYAYYAERKRNPAFAKAADEAIADGIAGMENELFRRGYQGIEKPLHHKGELTGHTVREYSDTLGIFLLKAHMPEKYGDRQTLNHQGEVTLTVRDLVSESKLEDDIL